MLGGAIERLGKGLGEANDIMWIEECEERLVRRNRIIMRRKHYNNMEVELQWVL